MAASEARDVVRDRTLHRSTYGLGVHTTRNPWSSGLLDGEFLPRAAERKGNG